MTTSGSSRSGTSSERTPDSVDPAAGRPLRPRSELGAETTSAARTRTPKADPGTRTDRRLTRSAESDELLVDRVRAGDRAAFEEIYRRYFKRIYAFLDRRLGNRADTEETTQEVFINIFASLGSFRGEAPFAAWIFGLTRRTLAARFRRKRHPTVPLFDEDEEVSFSSLTVSGYPEPTPLENYEMTERAERLRHLMDHEISDEQRRLFEMHHLRSMPIAEIARVLSKSEDAIKSGLYRTRKLLLR